MSARPKHGSTRLARRAGLSMFDLAPTVTATGSAFRTRQSMRRSRAFRVPCPSATSTTSGSTPRGKFDLFGRVRRGVNAQAAFAEASEHSLDSVQLTARGGSRARVLRAARRAAIAPSRRGSAENQRKTVALDAGASRRGRGTAFDVERAKTALSLTLAALPNLRRRSTAGCTHRGADRANAERCVFGSLRVVMTLLIRAAARISQLALWRASRFARWVDSRVRQSRPDVQRGRAPEAAQSLPVGAAKADYMPRSRSA